MSLNLQRGTQEQSPRGVWQPGRCFCRECLLYQPPSHVFMVVKRNKASRREVGVWAVQCRNRRSEKSVGSPAEAGGPSSDGPLGQEPSPGEPPQIACVSPAGDLSMWHGQCLRLSGPVQGGLGAQSSSPGAAGEDRASVTPGAAVACGGGQGRACWGCSLSPSPQLTAPTGVGGFLAHLIPDSWGPFWVKGAGNLGRKHPPP